MRTPPIDHRAFTLVEMLAVLAIITVLALISGMSLNSMMRSQDIGTTAEAIESEFSKARMTALARNRRVEVRLYRYDELNSGSDSIRGIQSFIYDEDGVAEAISRVRRIPRSVVINEDTTNNTFLDLADKGWSIDPQINLPDIGTTYSAKSFQFRPDGSTNLDRTLSWFLSVHDRSIPVTDTTLPPNFAVIQVFPVTGSTQTYRP